MRRPAVRRTDATLGARNSAVAQQEQGAMTQRIGWIGLGRMGEAMVGRATAAGHGVDV